jgi:hypothetical protein
MYRKLKYFFGQVLKGKIDNLILWVFQIRINSIIINFQNQGTTQTINNNPIPNFSSLKTNQYLTNYFNDLQHSRF